MTDRELDALVAEKVMGLTLDWEMELECDHLVAEKCGKCLTILAAHPYDIPNYSTSIDAAWSILEKLGGMHGLGWAPVRKLWTAYFQINIDHPTHRASDKLASKAICLAALAVLDGYDKMTAKI